MTLQKVTPRGSHWANSVSQGGVRKSIAGSKGPWFQHYPWLLSRSLNLFHVEDEEDYRSCIDFYQDNGINKQKIAKTGCGNVYVLFTSVVLRGLVWSETHLNMKQKHTTASTLQICTKWHFVVVWMTVSPPKLMLKTNPQCNGINKSGVFWSWEWGKKG